MLSINGPRLVAFVVLVVILCALPLFAPSLPTRRRIGAVACVLVTLWCVLAYESVGLFYVPSAIGLLLALLDKSQRGPRVLAT